MKNRVSALALVCFAASCLAAQAAAVYQWRDDAGNLHYSDRPIFPQNTQRTIKPNVTDGRSASAAAAAKSGIRLFVVDNCPPCISARELLDSNKVPYELHSITNSQQEVLTFYKTTNDTNSPLPVLAVGPDVYKGWDLTLWQAVLDKAGYHVVPPAH